MNAHDSGGLAAAKPPVGTGPVPLVGQLLAIALIGLGVVGVQDLLARTDVVAQEPWTDTALGAVDGLASDDVWVVVGGVLAVLLGLLLLGVALRRRPRKTLELKAATGVRLRTRDLPRLLRDSLETVDGVSDVDVRAKRRTVTVLATTVVRQERRAEVKEALEARLAPTLATLERAPRARIKLKEGAS